MKRKIIIAATGASGAIYTKQLLNWFNENMHLSKDIAVIYSDTAKDVWEFELGDQSYNNYGFKFYANNDFYASCASGSSDYDTMIIIPCSMGTMGRIANGTSDDLIARAADVMLKERRKLILVLREAPYNYVHIKNMKTLTNAGAIISSASPSFYGKPKTIDDIILTVIYRTLELAGFETNNYKWGDD